MTREPVHTYAGNPLERGEALRRDETAIESLRQHPKARFLAFHKLRVAVDTQQQLIWYSSDLLTQPHTEVVLLGLLEDQPLFAVDLNSAPAADLLEIEVPADFADVRLIASVLNTADAGILAQARAQLDWHRRNPYCAACGGVTQPERGGQIRRCQTCQKHTFPRTDAVAIMLIVNEPGGDLCLLGKGQGRMAKANFYSCLAGFIDQAESLEDAVRREVLEEAGIPVGRVVYHSSQPWPFPSQLMMGCHGIATDTQINFDPVEMSDVAWFSRSEVNDALMGKHPELNLPGPNAIAHHLIQAWVKQEVAL